MSSNLLFAVLTVLVIGIVSFLIGKFLTSSKWKKKYLEADSQNKLLEKRKIFAEAALKDEKTKEEEARKKIKQQLATNRSKDQKIKDLETRLKRKVKTEGHTDEAYNELLNALNAEKKKVISLEGQLAKKEGQLAKKESQSAKKAVVASAKKRTSTSTFKSFDNAQLGTQKVLDTKPKYTGILAPILDRMSMFNNVEEKDDLTKVDGITTIISDKLKKAGIHNYKQIAMLENKDFPIVAKVVGLPPDDINKYNWIGLAKDLYHRKYKSEL